MCDQQGLQFDVEISPYVVLGVEIMVLTGVPIRVWGVLEVLASCPTS